LNDKKAGAEQFSRILNEATNIAKRKTTLLTTIEPDLDFPPSMDRPVGQFRVVRVS
ncbi:MAG: hypothetical protein GY762_07815, partial [Proteobacteria bacterium]|nr:hypothetical protein [Pseudomonadota bacterium]